MYWVSFVKLAFLEELSEEADEVEGGLDEDIVVAGIGDRGEGFLFRGREFVEAFSILKRDDLIFFAVDDEEGRMAVGDVFEIGESVTEEDRDTGDGAESAEEGGDEDHAAVILTSGEPAGGAGADRLADEDDLVRGNTKVGGEVLIGGFDGVVAAFFGGLAAAFSVAGEVVGDYAEALEVEGIESGAQGFEILGIAVRPEKGGHFRGSGTMIDGDGFLSDSEGGEVGAVLGIWGARRLEDELIGKEKGEEGEEEVDPADGVEGAFPGPFADEDLFPIHSVRIDGRSLFDKLIASEWWIKWWNPASVNSGVLRWGN